MYRCIEKRFFSVFLFLFFRWIVSELQGVTTPSLIIDCGYHCTLIQCIEKISVSVFVFFDCERTNVNVESGLIGEVDCI